jgi:hypothetical protein
VSALAVAARGVDGVQLALVDAPPPRAWVLNLGLGADSSAMLVRLLREPALRPLPLDRLIVVVAMTGSEFGVTAQLVTRHILPLLAEHQVRTVQVARAGAREADGIRVLDDSRSPTVLYVDGAHRLRDELFAAGTVPQVGGRRLCSCKFKGWPIDRWLAGALAGEPFVQLMGFEAGEQRRAGDDAAAGDSWQRTGAYPLVEWGWSREDCERYLHEQTGVRRWPKSACPFCPFSLCSRAGRARTFDAFAREPHQALEALMIERLAVALNERQGLAGGRRLADLLAADPAGAGLLAAFDRQLQQTPHALCEVRRVLRPKRSDPTRLGNARRHLRILATGDREQMIADLDRRAAAAAIALDVEDVVPRLWLRRRAATFPSGEHFLTVAPAGAVDKGDARFDQWWNALPIAAATTSGD